ncbi:helicase C-terminal domain-containing protein [Lacticaseibacillus sp. 866-1]|uniref:helicase C-terminal domain-containing protein n=1 Tax=Lacticaseibacillus sp. 866-1 TaxID=2799576 RepID=UPI001941285D|nr:helicase C-terminal domain-containing protein [Lacticaseibacillus sp. 866-1]
MSGDTVYAVIDLETTGTERDSDRIIQFGCAVMQDGHILSTMSQMINPDRPVPQAIQRLTGIHPADLTAAPYFADVAGTIRDLIGDAVIVAHNVNFDYPFLSNALTLAGQPPLTNAAVDTVELSQVLLPTQASYRLSDLTAALGITHDHPHRADSDAISTAKLLWRLRAVFQALPTPTQKLLSRHGTFLLRDTGDFLKAAVKPDQPLTADMQQVGDLVIRQPQGLEPEVGQAVYPADDAAKKAMLRPQFRFRQVQAHMMDMIHTNALGERRPLMIEAGTGAGKSLGYLLPYAYLASPAHQLVVTTHTTLLQTQLVNKELKSVRELTGLTLPAVLLKSPRHYLDLAKFAASLQLPRANRLTRLLQMKIIVWLTQTATGDLDELQLTNYHAPLFARIQATGDNRLAMPGPYADADFLVRLKNEVQRAAIIVTNHAYLARHFQELPGTSDYLVVDEAQHFADTTAEAFSRTLDLGKLRRRLGQLLTFIEGQHGEGLSQLVQSSAALSYQLSQARAQIETLENQIEQLQDKLYRRNFTPISHPSGRVAQTLDEAGVSWLNGELDAPLAGLKRQLPPLLASVTSVAETVQQQQSHFGAAPLLEGLAGLLSALQRQTDRLSHLDLQGLAKAQVVVGLTLANQNDRLSLAVTWTRFAAGAIIQEELSHFTAPVFVGATLTVGRKFDYLAGQLGYQDFPEAQTLRLRSPFHYKQQAQVFLATDAPNAHDLPASAYADYLAGAIAQLADNQHQTLVLFTSLAMIDEVYRRLARMPIAGHKELLAQGVTGTASRIAKRFAVGEQTLLLGAASFFEGVDYPDKQLEQVILTRLPFDNPDRPDVRAREQALAARGEDPFAADMLPRAILRFRQSFGRLIRTERDRGVFVVLDPRLGTTAYGRQMAKSLPNLKPMSLPLADLIPLANAWLDHTIIKKEAHHAQ